MRMRDTRRWTWGYLLFGAALILEPSANAVAEEKEPSNEAREDVLGQQTAADAGHEASEKVSGSAGFKAYIDPETGKLTETPTQAQREQLQLSPELENAFSVSSDGLEQVFLPDGTVKVDLQGRFQNAVFATVAADGTVTLGHDVLPLSSLNEPADDERTAGGEQ